MVRKTAKRQRTLRATSGVLGCGGELVVISRRAHRSKRAGVLACAFAYLFVLQATLAATLNAWLPHNPSLQSSEICHAVPGNGDPNVDSSIDVGHVKAAGRCSLCLVPGFGLFMPQLPVAVAVRAALGVAYEQREPARIELAKLSSPHRARAPPRYV